MFIALRSINAGAAAGRSRSKARRPGRPLRASRTCAERKAPHALSNPCGRSGWGKSRARACGCDVQVADGRWISEPKALLSQGSAGTRQAKRVSSHAQATRFSKSCSILRTALELLASWRPSVAVISEGGGRPPRAVNDIDYLVTVATLRGELPNAPLPFKRRIRPQRPRASPLGHFGLMPPA